MMDEHLQRVEKDLGDPTFLQYFRRFLQQTYCAENLYFWETANKWNEEYPALSPQQRIERAQLIHSLYFAPLSENELNLDVLVREKVDRKISEQDIDQNIFLETQFAVFSLLSSDSYPKFTDSELYQHYKAGTPLPEPIKTNELPLNITAEEFESSFIFTGVAKRSNFEDPQSNQNSKGGSQSKQGGVDKGNQKSSLSSGIKSYLTSWLPVPNKGGGSVLSTTSPPGSPLPSTVPSLTTIVNPLDAKLRKLEEKRKDSRPVSTTQAINKDKSDKKKRFKWKDSNSPETSPVGSPTMGSPLSSPSTMSPQSESPTTSPRSSLRALDQDRNAIPASVAEMLSVQLATERGTTSPIDAKTPNTTSSGETSPLASSPPSTASPKPPRGSPKFSTLTGLPQRTQFSTQAASPIDTDAKKVAGNDYLKGTDPQDSEDSLTNYVASISLATSSHSAPDIHESSHIAVDGSVAATASFTDASKPMGLPASIMHNKKKKKRFAFGLKKED